MVRTMTLERMERNFKKGNKINRVSGWLEWRDYCSGTEQPHWLKVDGKWKKVMDYYHTRVWVDFFDRDTGKKNPGVVFSTEDWPTEIGHEKAKFLFKHFHRDFVKGMQKKDEWLDGFEEFEI